MNIAGWNCREEANFSYLSPMAIFASEGISQNGVITNSHIDIPEGTPYKINRVLKVFNGLKLVVAFELPDCVFYDAELKFDSIEAARRAGWAV